MALATAGDRATNALAVTLTTFVLMRRFEEVVDAANARLQIMSNGRYELSRSDDRERHAGRLLGLALRVVDHQTETTRDPATLSGGETFYVSLCLALGLADVVTAESGGVDLGTLFIDEGFGSLDQDTLDVVVAELSRLRDSGRTVGVVSHVDALKSVIPERIQIRRGNRGSTLEVVA
jgi:exonuclease SbcC